MIQKVGIFLDVNFLVRSWSDSVPVPYLAKPGWEGVFTKIMLISDSIRENTRSSETHWLPPTFPTASTTGA
jgi:hypothetical protein